MLSQTLARIDALSRDHPVLALKLLDRHAQLAAALGDAAAELDALYVRYMIHERRGENSLVADAVEAGIASASRAGLAEQGTRLLQASARIAQVEGKYQLAIEKWMHVIELADATGDYETAAEARIGLSHVNHELGNHAEAERYLTAAMRDAALAGNGYLAAKCAINAGVASNKHQDWQGAFVHFSDGLRIAQQHRIREYVAESHWHVGYAEMMLGRFADAEHSLAMALKLAGKYRYRWLESVTLDTQAELYTRIAKWPQAIVSTSAAFELARQTQSLARMLEYAQKMVDLLKADQQWQEALTWAGKERELSTEHFRRCLIPIHRTMKALDLSEQDINESLYSLSLLAGEGLELEVAMPILLERLYKLFGVDCVATWLMDGFTRHFQLFAQYPAQVPCLDLIGQDSGRLYELLLGLKAPLALSRVDLHADAEQIRSLFSAQPVSSMILLPLKFSGETVGSLILANFAVEHTWTRDDVFRGNFICGLIEGWLATENRRQLQLEIERHERSNALGLLVASVAHELNTPIGVCVTAGSTLKDEIGRLVRLLHEGRISKKDLQSFLDTQKALSETLNRNLQRVSELTQRFQELRQQDFDDLWEQTTLAGFLQNLLAPEMASLQERGIRVELEGDPEMQVTMPTVVMAQIVSQIVDNAKKHAFVGRTQGIVQLTWGMRNGYFQLRYADNGIGMAPARFNHIFDPYFSRQFAQNGQGTGMAKVYQLVHRHLKGTIAATSAPGQGLQITIQWLHEKGDAPASPLLQT